MVWQTSMVIEADHTLVLGPWVCFESLISWILALAMIATHLYYCGGSIELKLSEN
jgi:hypothetical protein